MSINKTYAVFGLGKYGKAVAKELVDNGIEVLAIDKNEEIVNDAALEIPVCKCADVTDPEVIKQLDIGNIDVVIVSMAESLEASVMAITLCKEAGVKTIIAKCSDEIHKKIFSRVGADRVVFPEKESGLRLAKNLLSNGFIDIIGLSKDVSMVEIPVKAEWIGKNLVELKFRSKYSMNVVAIIKGESVITNIDPTLPLEKNSTLIVIANRDKLGKI
jgi:trk system potassium uptake protein TrkA